MRRTISIIVVIVLIISFAGCSKQENDYTNSNGASVEVYLEKAQVFIDQGNYSAAIELLEKGYEVTKDERLATLLAEAYAKQLESEKGTTPPTSNQEDPPDVSDTTDPTKPKQPGLEVPDITINPSLQVPDIAKIQQDLLDRGENLFYIDYDNVDLSIDDIEVLRRKSDEKNDEIHIAVSFSNEYYIVNEEFTLFYSYYDVGGWYLEDYIITSYQSRAIDNPVSDEDFLEMLSYQFDSCSIDSRTQEISADGTYFDYITFSASVEYEYLVVCFKGTYTYTFTDDAWIYNRYLWIDHNDWSAFEGNFRYRDPSLGGDSADIQISITDIQQISDTKLSISYSGSVYLHYNRGGWTWIDEEVPQITQEIRIYTQSITIWGIEFIIPRYASSIVMPWANSSTISVYLFIENGVEARDLEFAGSVEHFDRVVSDDELQDAFDKLHRMNP